MNDAGIRPTARTATRWGCSVGAGMMGVAFSEMQCVHAFCGAEGEFHPAGLLDGGFPADPVGFCRSQTNAGLALLTNVLGDPVKRLLYMSVPLDRRWYLVLLAFTGVSAALFVAWWLLARG